MNFDQTLLSEFSPSKVRRIKNKQQQKMGKDKG